MRCKTITQNASRTNEQSILLGRFVASFANYISHILDVKQFVCIITIVLISLSSCVTRLGSIKYSICPQQITVQYLLVFLHYARQSHHFFHQHENCGAGILSLSSIDYKKVYSFRHNDFFPI